MSPPFRGGVGTRAGLDPAVATTEAAASAEVAVSRRRRERESVKGGVGHDVCPVSVAEQITTGQV